MSAPDDQRPMAVRLDEETIDRLAHRVADVLGDRDPERPPSPPRAVARRMLSAAQVAEHWQIDREWVYAHADELGVQRLGTGPRPRLRFDPEVIAQRLRPADPEGPAPRAVRRRSGAPDPWRSGGGLRGRRRSLG